MQEKKKWITSNLNDGHLDYYFYLLAALMFGIFLCYLWSASQYEYRTFDEQKPEMMGSEISNQYEDSKTIATAADNHQSPSRSLRSQSLGEHN